MLDMTISKELARQFAYECYDEIVGAIQAAQDEHEPMEEDDNLNAA